MFRQEKDSKLAGSSSNLFANWVPNRWRFSKSVRGWVSKSCCWVTDVTCSTIGRLLIFVPKPKKLLMFQDPCFGIKFLIQPRVQECKFKNRCSKHSDSFVQIPFIGEMVPNLVIQNYPDLSKEMKNGHKKHFLVRVILYETMFGSILGLKGPKLTPFLSILVHIGCWYAW